MFLKMVVKGNFLKKSYLMKQESLEAEAVLYMPVAYFSVVLNMDRVYYGRTDTSLSFHQS